MFSKTVPNKALRKSTGIIMNLPSEERRGQAPGTARRACDTLRSQAVFLELSAQNHATGQIPTGQAAIPLPSGHTTVWRRQTRWAI